MALPNRNTDIVINVNGAAPSPSINARDWPKALPDAMNRIVIAYLDPTIDEVKKLDEHFKQLGNETVAPFRNAIKSKVDPLLKRPTMASIYQSKPQKSKWYFVENSPEKLLDDYIKQMSHLPTDEQLDFLCAVYDGDWKREEKGDFKQMKESLNALYDSFSEHKQSEVFKARIAQVIFEKLNGFISYVITHSYQDSQEDSQARMAKVNDDKRRETKIVESVGQLLRQEQYLVSLNGDRGACSYLCFLLIMGGGGIFLALGLIGRRYHQSYPSEAFVYLGGFLLGFGSLLAIGMCVYGYLQGRHQNQVNILQTAQPRLFQPIREANTDNNNDLTAPLLTAEEKAEAKEEPGLRPGSP